MENGERVRRSTIDDLKRDPDLRDTLQYMAILMRPDLDTPLKQSRELGIDERTLLRRSQHPHWQLAKELATAFHSSRTREKSFGEYVFKNLTPEAKKIWEKLNYWAEHSNRQQYVEQIISGTSKRIRQELFIHALVSTHFDMSKALSLTGLSKNTLMDWMATDLEFRQLVEEIQWHKKNFFESALLDLVRERNPLAVIWVNKTANADRGYSEKRLGSGESIGNGNITIDRLDLDIDTRRKVLMAIRKAQEEEIANRGVKQLANTPVIDLAPARTR